MDAMSAGVSAQLSNGSSWSRKDDVTEVSIWGTEFRVQVNARGVSIYTLVDDRAAMGSTPIFHLPLPLPPAPGRPPQNPGK